MSTVVEAINHLFNFPETLDKFMLNSSSRAGEGAGSVANDSRGGVGSLPAVDILDSPKAYVFYVDVPGLSKSDIQVTLEDENTLVIRSNGKRKREDGEEEGCKYIRLERSAPQKLSRKFRLPDNANASAISANCENGVLTVAVEKLPPPPKSKTVQVAIS
ncbi:unnamed protein product [Coffea canephora]|uniref:SHSP domain-containing protein n=2 Tax=Coffea TaxID=13442 RepID=A0A068TPE5_COFCA|nr:17.4 kDa class III heat shock protein-like [Coffea arabica]CDO97809.1 unnamed protein product [Coffea canephora]